MNGLPRTKKGQQLIERLPAASSLALPCAVAVLLTGCWHEAHPTVVENQTGYPINLVIRFEDPSVPTGRGDIEFGNLVSMPQTIDEISALEYVMNGLHCRMNKSMIEQAARAQPHGMQTIILRECVLG